MRKLTVNHELDKYYYPVIVWSIKMDYGNELDLWSCTQCVTVSQSDLGELADFVSQFKVERYYFNGKSVNKRNMVNKILNTLRKNNLRMIESFHNKTNYNNLLD